MSKQSYLCTETRFIVPDMISHIVTKLISTRTDPQTAQID